jgi:tetratricopeptide (TPR) repeat protein
MRASALILSSIFLVLLVGCSAEPAKTEAPPAAVPASADGDVPHFDGLGTHARVIAAANPEAQRYFDQGLIFLYGFNHDEAIRAFRKAAALAPEAPMPWWGVAVAYGPHINFPIVPPDKALAAWEALGKARERAALGSEVEQALIEAVGKRYANPQPEDRKPLDEAYAAAMRDLTARFPQDDDVAALFAESMMDLRPWDLWTPDGKQQPGTDEILRTLETVLARSPKHALHLYIHSIEMSPQPHTADQAADTLRDLVPALGHLVHMPSHIDVRTGRWQQAIEANIRAEKADVAYRERVPKQNFYRVYMAHNHHMRTFASMMIGRSAEAIQTIDTMVAEIPPDWARENAFIIDGFLAMPWEVRMRFGKWEELLAMPDLPESFTIARSLRHAARGIACAVTGKKEDARAEQKAFEQLSATVTEDAIFGNNTGRGILEVAAHLLEGELSFQEGNRKKGLAELRKAVELEDALRYDEPPDWINPVRHALGAALIQDKKSSEAEQVYREDLEKLPGNGWSLFGLARALRLQGKTAEADKVEAEFKEAWASSDVTLHASCFCQPGV